MSKLTGPVDALLAARLAPRLESIAIAAGIATGVATNAPTGPVVKVAGVENDPRLPSGTVLEQQLPARVSAGALPLEPASPSAPRLSAAARIIGALLAELHDAGPVRGTKPLLASSQAPVQAALAGALAQTVADSGLFYESHLRQFVAGTRTLAQLATEPQARFAAAQTHGAAPLPITGVLPQLPQALPVVAASDADASAVGAQPASDDAGVAAPAIVPSPTPASATDAMRVQAAYGWSAPAASAPGAAAAAAPEAAPAQPAGEAARSAASASAAAQAPAAAEIIHPQAATVVHQQLDLLATAVFRWSGHAWPDVPMEWSIREDADTDADAHATDPGRARSWTTTVSLVLPRLGAVDLRLSLAGAVVQARVMAGETATLARLQDGRGGLAQRLEGAGLHLQALQITAMPPAAASPGVHA